MWTGQRSLLHSPSTPPGRNHLFVPGPVNVHERVLRAMNVPGQNHRDPWFADFFKACLVDSKYIFKTTEATPFLFPGTGTGGWEAALTNTLSPGDKVVTFRYGLFSHLWIDMMQRMGLEVVVIEGRWGDGADEAKLEAILREDKEKKIKAVCVVQNETTTGVTSDIAGCRKAMDSADHPSLLLVDGVSSIGAIDFRMDEWRVDVAVTGSQKALSLPTGLALVAASNKVRGRTGGPSRGRMGPCHRVGQRGTRGPPSVATHLPEEGQTVQTESRASVSGTAPGQLNPLACMKTATSKRCYFDFADQLRTNPSGSVPYTPSLPLLYGLREAVSLLKSEGLDNVIARHHRLATGVRKAVGGWGLEVLCKDPRWYSDTLTVVEVPKGVDSNKVVKSAYAKYDLSLGVGLAELNGKVFRIGHLGNLNELMLVAALGGVEMAMRDAGIPIVPGSGVSKAIEHFHATAKVIPTRESLMV
ncbi:MAG: hypothetical protein WDW36_007552 [Sanguina aurantia]